PARRQRRRQDHDDQDALRPGGAELGAGGAGRRDRQAAPVGGGAAAARLHVAEVLALRRSGPRGEPGILRRRLRALAGAARGARAARRMWVPGSAGLAGMGKKPPGRLPGGGKQRVAFGAAIMHEPRVLFLDEPTSGVDPIARRTFWTMINRLADEGAAVLITT